MFYFDIFDKLQSCLAADRANKNAFFPRKLVPNLLISKHALIHMYIRYFISFKILKSNATKKTDFQLYFDIKIIKIF